MTLQNYTKVAVVGMLLVLGCGPNVVDADTGSDTATGTASASGTTSTSSTSTVSTTSSSDTGLATSTSTSTSTGTTTGISTGSSSGVADDGCLFIACVDMGGPNLIPCDPFAEQPCPVGMKCTYDHHPKGGSFVCGEQLGEDGLFDPCELDFSPADTCAPGLTCQPAAVCGQDQTCCTPICDPVDGDPPCPDPAPQCIELYGAGYCDL